MWEVRAGAGPAGGGLRGHADGSKILIMILIRVGKGLRDVSTVRLSAGRRAMKLDRGCSSPRRKVF